MASLLKGSKAYVNGQWVEASTGKTFEVKNPVDGKVIASVPDMSAGDTKVAIDAASKVSTFHIHTVFPFPLNTVRETPEVEGGGMYPPPPSFGISVIPVRTKFSYT